MSKPLFTGVNHLCVVTADLERAVRTWADRYGIGSWSIWTKDPSNMVATVEGEPVEFAMRVALCQVSPFFRLELIQPLDSRSPYADSLAAQAGADHVHHVRFDVEDYDEARARLDALGAARLFEGRFAGSGGEFVGTYYDTVADLGFISEIGRAPDAFAMPEPEAVYPQSESTSPAASNAVSMTRSGP